MNPEDLAAEIQRVLTGYAAGIKEEIEVAKKETAQALVKELKATSPKKSGSYQKGWRIKKNSRRNVATYIVHNATDYQLTHLLEHGHAKRNGGRVSARVHIAPAEEKHVKEYIKRIEKAIENES